MRQPVKSKCEVKTISIRKEDHEKIKQIAKNEKRSFSSMVVILADQYLERNKK